ncbi:hypothetical protein P692DRAFT_20829767 [Suillus brevipes Sb2]|nr:hypothetical protein P692DRAFT_20829767 [Suillus brevipes Sb2]
MRIQLPRLQSTSYLHMTQDTPDTSSNRSESPEAAQYMPHNGLHGFIPGLHYSVPTANAYTGAINMYAPQGPVYATEFAPPVVFQAEAAQAPVLATGFAPPVVSEGQAPGTKRAATDSEGPHAKRAKTGPTAISDDPLFEPMSDEHGQPNGKFKCTKDGMVINAESYRKHIKTKNHLGIKLEAYRCPGCSKTYARRDSCKRHYYGSACGRDMIGLPKPSFLAVPAAASSSVVPPVVVPTVAFTYHHPHVMPQHAQTALPAPAAGAPHHAFAAIDPALL